MNYEKYVNNLPYARFSIDAEKNAAYKMNDKKLYCDFKRDLLDELGVSNHPKADALFSLAWSYGHSAGYEEVFNYADELSQLLT